MEMWNLQSCSYSVYIETRPSPKFYFCTRRQQIILKEIALYSGTYHYLTLGSLRTIKGLTATSGLGKNVIIQKNALW